MKDFFSKIKNHNKKKTHFDFLPAFPVSEEVVKYYFECARKMQAAKPEDEYWDYPPKHDFTEFVDGLSKEQLRVLMRQITDKLLGDKNDW